jgi:hypothetical protein
MRISRILIIALLGLPLGGCFGVTLPSQPLPDWAMSPQAGYDAPRTDPAAGAARKKQHVVRRRAPNDVTAADSALMTGGTRSGAQPTAHAVETKPFAPGWDAREDERDPSLRRTLNICGGC